MGLPYFSAHVIGPECARKINIKRRASRAALFPFKVIYRGDNIEASNFALPTPRLVGYFQRRRRDRNAERSRTEGKLSGTSGRRKMSLGQMLWAAGRLVNFLAEEWYRQLLSWIYQAQGYIVLYDR